MEKNEQAELRKKYKEDIEKACEVMFNGGIILYPTDTIWGIGCDATNPEAVKRVYEIKKRIDSKALITLVDSPAKVNAYVQDMPEIAWDLIEFATKPLTIIYDKARNLKRPLHEIQKANCFHFCKYQRRTFSTELQ